MIRCAGVRGLVLIIMGERNNKKAQAFFFEVLREGTKGAVSFGKGKRSTHHERKRKWNDKEKFVDGTCSAKNKTEP